MTQRQYQFITQRGNRRLSVRSRHAYQRQRLTRFTEPFAGQQAQRLICVLYENKRHVLRIVHECTITQNDRTCAFGDTTINERVSIYCCAHLRNEQITFARSERAYYGSILYGYDEPGNIEAKKEHYALVQKYARRFEERFRRLIQAVNGEA